MAKYVARYYAKVYFDIDIEVPDKDGVPTLKDVEEYVSAEAIDTALLNVYELGGIEFDEIEAWDIEEVTNGE